VAGKNKTTAKVRERGLLVRGLETIFGPLNWRNLYSWAILILLILTVRWAWFEPYKIPSGSMEPTLMGNPNFFMGDRVFVNKHVYGLRVPFQNKYLFRWKNPERWDIVVFKAAHDDPEHHTLIKRIVGMPGERIHITAEGRISVNGEVVPFPEGLEDTLHYTYGVELSEEMAKSYFVRAVAEGKKPKELVRWDDRAREIVLENAITGEYPNLLNAEHPAVQKYRDEVERLRRELQDRGITTLEEAEAAGFLDKISPEVMQVAKELFILYLSSDSDLPRYMHSAIYVQSNVEQFLHDWDMVRARIKAKAAAGEVTNADIQSLARGVSPRTLRIVNELYRARSDSNERFKYGIRKEDEYSLIPEDHYMMLGDNSGNSIDSRVYGWVPRNHLVGRTFAIWWPPQHWKDFTGFSKTWWGMALLYGLPLTLAVYLYVHHSVYRVVRIHSDTHLPGLAPRRKVAIDCKAFGLRWPFVKKRIFRGREPESNEPVLFKQNGRILLGAVAAGPGAKASKGKKRVPDNHYVIDVQDDDSSGQYLVHYNDLIGPVRTAVPSESARNEG